MCQSSLVCMRVCVYGGVCGGVRESGLHKWSMCGCSAAVRSIHVTAANGVTTSLLPVTICLLCANLSQHIQVWPCPHLTLSEERGLWEEKTGEKGRKEKIRALPNTGSPGAKSREGNQSSTRRAKTTQRRKLDEGAQVAEELAARPGSETSTQPPARCK